MEQFLLVLGRFWHPTVIGAGLVFGYLFGGWTFMLELMLVAMVADYITGMVASYTEGGKLSSKLGFKRLPKKVLIWIMIALSHFVDRALGSENTIMNATIFFYLSNELLSITENVGRAGLPLPDGLMQAIEVLRTKGGSKQNDNNSNPGN